MRWMRTVRLGHEQVLLYKMPTNTITILTLNRHSLASCLSFLDLRDRFRACRVSHALVPFANDVVSWQYSRYVLPLMTIPRKFHRLIRRLEVLDTFPEWREEFLKEKDARGKTQDDAIPNPDYNYLKHFVRVTSIHLGSTFFVHDVKNMYGLLEDTSSNDSSSSSSASQPLSFILSLSTESFRATHPSRTYTSMSYILSHPRFVNLQKLVLKMPCDSKVKQAIEKLRELRYLELTDPDFNPDRMIKNEEDVNVWNVIQQLTNLETFITCIRRDERVYVSTTNSHGPQPRILPPLPPSLKHMTLRFESIDGLMFENWLDSSRTIESLNIALTSTCTLIKDWFLRDTQSFFDTIAQFNALQSVMICLPRVGANQNLRSMMTASAIVAATVNAASSAETSSSSSSSSSVVEPTPSSMNDLILHKLIESNESHLEVDAMSLTKENDLFTMKRIMNAAATNQKSTSSLTNNTTATILRTSSLKDSSLPLLVHHIPRYTSLTNLFLNNVQFSLDTSNALEQFAKCSQSLKFLNMNTSSETVDTGVETSSLFFAMWAAIGAHRNLEKFTLTTLLSVALSTKYDSHPCESGINALRHLHRLAHLSLLFNKTVFSMVTTHVLSELPRLTYLDIGLSNYSSPEALRVLLKSKSLKKLELVVYHQPVALLTGEREIIGMLTKKANERAKFQSSFNGTKIYADPSHSIAQPNSHGRRTATSTASSVSSTSSSSSSSSSSSGVRGLLNRLSSIFSSTSS